VATNEETMKSKEEEKVLGALWFSELSDVFLLLLKRNHAE
jgi:hypothetical protein